MNPRLHAVYSMIRSVVFRRRLETDISEELAFHIEERARHLSERDGLEPGDALRRARLEFGSREKYREEARQSFGVHQLDVLVQDLRYGVRRLVKTPMFTCIAVATIALGIGANATVFSVVYSVLFRPLPYTDSDRLVRVGARGPGGPVSVTNGQLFEWRNTSRTLNAMSGYRVIESELRDQEIQAPIRAAFVSPTIFPLLGAAPLFGRTLDIGDEQVGYDDTVVLSHSAWRTYFGGDAEVIGRSIAVGEDAYTIVGVMPPDFAFPDYETALWIPLVLRPFEFNVRRVNDRFLIGLGGRQPVEVIARLAEGASLDAANTEAAVVFQRLLEGENRTRRSAYAAIDADAPDRTMGTVEIVRLLDNLVRPVQSGFLVVSIAVSLVLIIASVNVANLVLARTSSGRTELAVRGALGAGRLRLVRQVLTESVLIAASGGALGVLIAFGSIQVLARVGAGSIPRIEQVAIDLPVFVFAAGASIVAGLLFGLVPALRLPTFPANTLQKNTSDVSSGSVRAGSHRTLHILAGLEVGLAVILAAGAGLLIQSFLNVARFDWGYDTENILTFAVDASIQRTIPFYENVIERMEALPTVEAASVTSSVPVLFPPQATLGPTLLEDSSDSGRDVVSHIVSFRYFDTIRIPLLEGRTLEEGDRNGQPLVAVVNRTLAAAYGEADLVGRVLRLPGGNGEEVRARIVGIVGDVRYAGLDDAPEPELYMDVRQAGVVLPPPPPPPLPPPGAPPRPMTVPAGQNLVATQFVVRTTVPPGNVVADLRRLLYEADSAMTVSQLTTIDDTLERYRASPRFYAVLMGAFSTIAMLIAVVGVYGVVSYAVSQRTREIGIRTALGSTRAAAVWAVLRSGLAAIAVAIAGGALVAALLTRYLESLLFGLTPTDLPTFIVVVAVVAVAAGLALYLPTRRAVTVDPMVALRYE